MQFCIVRYVFGLRDIYHSRVYTMHECVIYSVVLWIWLSCESTLFFLLDLLAFPIVVEIHFWIHKIGFSLFPSCDALYLLLFVLCFVCIDDMCTLLSMLLLMLLLVRLLVYYCPIIHQYRHFCVMWTNTFSISIIF